MSQSGRTNWPIHRLLYEQFTMCTPCSQYASSPLPNQKSSPARAMPTCLVPRKKKSLHCSMLAIMPVPSKLAAMDSDSPA